MNFLKLIPFFSARRRAKSKMSIELHSIADVHDVRLAAAQLMAIVELSHDAIITTNITKDLHGIIASWSHGAEKLFGYRAAEVIGKSVTILIPPGRLGEETKILGCISRREQIVHYETVRIRKDGAEIDVSLTVLPVLDERGNVIGASKIARDITKRKQAEKKLRRSEACLAEGERLSHTGSWVWNVITNDLFWSQEQFRIFGFYPDEVKVTYEVAFELVHPEERADLRRRFENAVMERRDLVSNYRIVRPDRTIRHIHSVCHPVFDESGSLVEYIGTVVDVTERKQAEEAARSAQAELAHAARSLTLVELTASIAHEVNQPLGAIVADGQSCLRLLARDEPDLDDVREAVADMIGDAMRAHNVIRQIRALLKKEGPEREPLDVNETIQEVIAMTAGELEKSKVLLRTKLEIGLPQALGDRVQLQQVLLNLILNGCEAMSGAEWQPREMLISSRKCDPDHVMLAVCDSGVGITPQTAERFFDAFYTTKEGGLGLGLTISQRIIEAHGGRLWAEPNQDQGATLQFTVPTIRESQV